MWFFVKLLLLAVYVDSTRNGKNPLVVYIESGKIINQVTVSPVMEPSDEKLSGYKTLFKVLMNVLHVNVNDQGNLDKTLRAALKNRCYRLKTCKKSCSKAKGRIVCKEECEREIDEEDLCGEPDEVEANSECRVNPKSENDDECKAKMVEEKTEEKREEKREEKTEEKREEKVKELLELQVDECSSEVPEKKNECEFRARFRAKKNRKSKKRLGHKIRK